MLTGTIPADLRWWRDMAGSESSSERIEGAIERGIRQGDFDKLPGAGKPLDLGDPRDPDWWIKEYAQREKLDLAEALPGVAALRKESLEFADSLDRFDSEEAVRDAAEDLNRRIYADRMDVRNIDNAFPLAAPEVDADDMVAKWRLRQLDAAATTAADETGSNKVAAETTAGKTMATKDEDDDRSAIRTLYLRALKITSLGILAMALAILVTYWVFT